jgi:two-component system response regulator NreC
MSMAIRVMIADDHSVLREGLRMLIEAQGDMTVVGEATSGDEVIAQAQSTHPDVVLLDITMPGATGLELIPQLRTQVPESRILVLTMHDDPAYYERALNGGAHGYVLKRANSAELLSAIRAVAAGEGFVDLATARTIVHDRLADARLRPPVETAAIGQLSERSLALLKLLARGLTVEETARRLKLPISTVESGRVQLFHQLGVRSRAELVRYAARSGILDDGNSANGQ